MTLAEFITLIRGYTGFADVEVQTDAYLTAFVRQMERRVSTELRVGEMIQIDTATPLNNRFEVPVDWLENDFVRGYDGKPLNYKARNEFYNLVDGAKYYTMTGRHIVIGGDLDATGTIELSYFGDIPTLTEVDASSWLVEKFLEVAVRGTMMFASEAMTDNSTDWGGKFAASISMMNSAYQKSLGKGGSLSRRTGSFG